MRNPLLIINFELKTHSATESKLGSDSEMNPINRISVQVRHSLDSPNIWSTFPEILHHLHLPHDHLSSKKVIIANQWWHVIFVAGWANDHTFCKSGMSIPSIADVRELFTIHEECVTTIDDVPQRRRLLEWLLSRNQRGRISSHGWTSYCKIVNFQLNTFR
jgi:hypothetical protein